METFCRWRSLLAESFVHHLNVIPPACHIRQDHSVIRLQAVTIPSITNGQLPGQLDSPAMKLWPKGMVLYEVGTTGDHMGAPDRQVR